MIFVFVWFYFTLTECLQGPIMLLQMTGLPSYLWLNNFPLCLLYTRISLSVHSLIGSYVVSMSWLLYIMLPVDLEVQIPFWVSVFIYLRYPEVELLDHVVLLILIFLRNFHTFFHSTAMYIPINCPSLCYSTNSAWGFFFPHPHQHLLFLVFLILFW